MRDASVPVGVIDRRPVVSVVIAMRNEEAHIARCLDAVLAQDYPAPLTEIIVVDGRSTDASRRIVDAYRERDHRIRLLDNPGRLTPAGLNIAIRAAAGDIIARVDARVVIAPDYLAVGVDRLRATGAANVGGPRRSAAPGYRGRALALAWQSRFGLGGAAARYGEGRDRAVDTVYLGMFPRAALEAVGLFDEELVRDQDDELSYRLRARGGRILLTPALRSWSSTSPSLRRFVAQHLRYGYWKVRVWQKHPHMLSWRHFVPPLFVLALVAGGGAAVVDGRPRPIVLGIVAAYAAAAATAALGLARRHGWRYAPVLPLVFAVLHVSWGAGFLLGTVRFLPRWLGPEPAPPALSAMTGEAAR